jgi:biopolymer transport protein ExbD
MNPVAKARRNSIDEKLIPLINIVFLLLIFFMIAGQVSNPEDQSIMPPISDSERPIQQPKLLVEMGSVLRLNGVPISMEQLQLQIAEYSDLDKRQVDVKADKNLRAIEVEPLFTTLREQGVTTITLYSQSGE